MCVAADDITEQNFEQLVTDYFGRLNLNASVQKLLAVSNLIPYKPVLIFFRSQCLQLRTGGFYRCTAFAAVCHC